MNGFAGFLNRFQCCLMQLESIDTTGLNLEQQEQAANILRAALSAVTGGNITEQPAEETAPPEDEEQALPPMIEISVEGEGSVFIPASDFGKHWVNLSGLLDRYCHVFGQSHVFDVLIPGGLIKTTIIGREGTKRGKRVFYLPSVEEYLHSLAAQQDCA